MEKQYYCVNTRFLCMVKISKVFVSFFHCCRSGKETKVSTTSRPKYCNLWRQYLIVINPRPAGYLPERAPLGGGGQILPVHNSRKAGRSETGKAAIESSR